MTRNCGEAIIELLEKYEVDTVFGIPGVHTLDLYKGLPDSSIKHVQCRHEQGAGFMADGYARTTGKPGVALIITGPGVTNAATAMGQSWADSIPVLVISSANATYTFGKGWGCLHEITNQQAVTEPLTALSATALSPGEVPELVGQAFSIFASSRPRPVHIAVPIDVLAMPVSDEWQPVKPPGRPVADPARLAAAADLLAVAERPMICVGGGASEAGASLTAIAEALGAPVFASNAGKGIVPDSHPLCLGGSTQRVEGRQFLAQADVILAIGTELSETDSFVERLPITGKVIRVDLDPGKINDQYPASVGIVADAASTAAELLSALNEIGIDQPKSGAQAVASTRQSIRAGLNPVERQHARVLDTLRNVIPADTVIMGDISQLVYTGGVAMTVNQPRCWNYAAGFCTLGWALPGAIGAAFALPERPIMVLAGDGGFMFTVQELITAVEEKLSLPIVIWENGGLAQIRDDMLHREQEPVGVNSLGPDFVALGKAFGAEALRAANGDELQDAVLAAFQAEGPTIIEITQGADWLIDPNWQGGRSESMHAGMAPDV
jgi:thiamine pyrophosphate-dependent acetolactate synthase large subunit-like protein